MNIKNDQINKEKYHVNLSILELNIFNLSSIESANI